MFKRSPMILASVAVLAASVFSATSGVQAAAPAAPAPAPLKLPVADAPAGLKVFYASHSLMWDMFPVLTEMANAYGIKGHEVVGSQRLGVSRTSQHWDVADAQNTAKQALLTGKVDAFVMSPIGMPDEGITNFVKLGLEKNPKMKFYVQVSWPGMGLVDNNDMGNGAGGMPGMGGGMPGRGGAPGGAPGGRGGRGGPGAPGGAPGAAPGAPAPAAPAAPGAMGPLSDDALFFVGAPGAPAGPGADGPPGAGAPGARGGAPGAPGARGGARGGAPGGFGGMGGAQNYNKTAEELAQINVRNDKSAEEQAAKINAELGKGQTVIYLIPTSQAHNALRLAILKKEMPAMTDQGEVFADAIGHPTPPVIAMNTYLHFAVLYNRSPVGLPMPNVLKNAAKQQYNDEKLNLKLQQIAWDTVKNYKPSGVTAK